MELTMSRLGALGMAGLVVLAACADSEPPVTNAHTAAAPVLQPQPDWATELPALLPAIGACLARSGVHATGVTKGWAIADELAGVRLLNASGDRTDCIAVADGREVILTEKVWSASQLPGERSPLFTPASADRPSASQCLAVSVARNAAGRAVGWLSYDVCRQPRPAGPSAAIQPQNSSTGNGHSG
jgi:hypothetical protein